MTDVCEIPPISSHVGRHSQSVPLFWKFLVSLGHATWLEKLEVTWMVLEGFWLLLAFYSTLTLTGRWLLPHSSTVMLLPYHRLRREVANQTGAMVILFFQALLSIFGSDKESFNNQVIDKHHCSE